MKVYVAFAGEYSQRDAVGVYTSKGDAEECSVRCADSRDADPDVQEFELDDKP